MNLYIFAAIILTFGVLVAGLGIMMFGGKLNKKFATKLMSLRVIFQACAIFFLALAYFLQRK